VRSYLRKQGIAFVERLPSDPEFQRLVMPAVQRFINPVVRLPDGLLVQDTTDIIDHFEHSGQARFSVYPRGPLQRVVALALDLLGGEGLVRAAMHFRWSYRAHNEAFLRHEFGLSFRAAGLPQAAIDQQLDGFMGYLNAYLPKLGITAQSTEAVEAAYYALLSALDAHFRVQPYVLGGLPTVADFGFIANLYAHLGRDPYPSMQMKLQAPSVYRFTERMMASDADVPEFPQSQPALADDDTVPKHWVRWRSAWRKTICPNSRPSSAAWTSGWRSKARLRPWRRCRPNPAFACSPPPSFRCVAHRCRAWPAPIPCTCCSG